MRVVRNSVVILAALTLGLCSPKGASTADVGVNVQQEDELLKLRKARLKAIEDSLNSCIRLNELNREYAHLDRIFTLSHQRLQATLEMTEEPKARVESLKPILELAKKMEKDYQDKRGKDFNSGGFRVFTLSVEIELLKANRLAAKGR